jgi:hypothetical protein
MEDPVLFDVWIRSVDEHNEPEVRRILEARGGQGLIQRRAIVQARVSHTALLVAGEVGWSAVEAVRREVPGSDLALMVLQTGLKPHSLERASSCGVHELWYGGVLGCPVCTVRNL